ncbi:uncharacterized protein AMSG_11597 [Thecamonas trahens ATCC 50062]|uniref:Uncharacterized protein n=1 Tax=Thecamonas trahens ATCC 50062 TaxID=461836 RepID=A0A0L0D1R5_THETB|nr:hypothetical protein AMSG_11597 [Thecamonas trahens ATCC 50062]KNC46146.1 hypothetical protein AMSG_11597 [Thecamonas trahens ATCC 50062]|eukprot:XP_013763195.1 hypothetical protein AMSG_11597 [Thecamonas trahens ATCC 50062]
MDTKDEHGGVGPGGFGKDWLTIATGGRERNAGTLPHAVALTVALADGKDDMELAVLGDDVAGREHGDTIKVCVAELGHLGLQLFKARRVQDLEMRQRGDDLRHGVPRVEGAVTCVKLLE